MDQWTALRVYPIMASSQRPEMREERDQASGILRPGHLGSPMALSLLAAGQQLVIHDLRPEAAANLIELGAGLGGEPAGGRGSGRYPVPSPAIEQNLIRGKARGLGKLSYVAELAGRDRAGAAAGLSHTASALGGLIGPPDVTSWARVARCPATSRSARRLLLTR